MQFEYLMRKLFDEISQALFKRINSYSIKQFQGRLNYKDKLKFKNLLSC
jgi:hypothetical protein